MSSALSCPSEEMLRNFARGALDPQEIDEVDRHLDNCGSCLARLAAFDTRTESIAGALQQTGSAQFQNESMCRQAAEDALMMTRSGNTPPPLPQRLPPISIAQLRGRLVESGWVDAPEKAIELTQSHAEQADARPLLEQWRREKKLNSFQAEAIVSGKPKRLVFGQRVLVAKLGKGGFGDVFQAKHRIKKSTEAIKLLRAPQNGTISDSMRRRFHEEVQAQTELQHKNLALMYDADEVDGIPYCAMEFIQGETLHELVVKRGPLPIKEAVDYAMQVADGLAYAHSKGRMHRDIKPSNLMLDERGTVRILDLGLAAFEAPEEKPGLTPAGTPLGTPDYMPPEQWAGEATRQSDIYSLGCTLHVLLTGRVVFPKKTHAERMKAHLQEPAPNLRKLRRDAPPELQKVFKKMIAKDPKHRYSSMEECKVALAETLPADAPPPPPPKSGKLGMLAVALAAIVVCLATALGVILSLGSKGTVAVKVNEANAEITIRDADNNEVEKYTTRFNDEVRNFKLRKGEYEVNVEKTGLMAEMRKLSFAKKRHVEFTFVLVPPPPPPSTVSVIVDQPGANVELIGATTHSGTVTAAGSPLQFKVAPGAYTLTVSKVGFHIHSQQVSLRGQNGPEKVILPVLLTANNKFELSLAGVNDGEMPEDWTASNNMGVFELAEGNRGITNLNREGNGWIKSERVTLGKDFWINLRFGTSDRPFGGFVIDVLDSTTSKMIPLDFQFKNEWRVYSGNQRSDRAAVVEHEKPCLVRIVKKGKLATIFMGGDEMLSIATDGDSFDQLRITLNTVHVAIHHIEGGTLPSRSAPAARKKALNLGFSGIPEGGIPVDWQRRGKVGYLKTPGGADGIMVLKDSGIGMIESPIVPLGKDFQTEFEFDYFHSRQGNSGIAVAVVASDTGATIEADLKKPTLWMLYSGSQKSKDIRTIPRQGTFSLQVEKSGAIATFRINNEKVLQIPAEEGNYDRIQIYFKDKEIALLNVQEKREIADDRNSQWLELNLANVKDSELPAGWTFSDDLALWKLESGVSGITRPDRNGGGAMTSGIVDLGSDFWVNVEAGFQAGADSFSVILSDSAGGETFQVDLFTSNRALQGGKPWHAKSGGISSGDEYVFVRYSDPLRVRIKKKGNVAVVLLNSVEILRLQAPDANFDQVRIRLSDANVAITRIEGGSLSQPRPPQGEAKNLNLDLSGVQSGKLPANWTSIGNLGLWNAENGREGIMFRDREGGGSLNSPPVLLGEDFEVAIQAEFCRRAEGIWVGIVDRSSGESIYAKLSDTKTPVSGGRRWQVSTTESSGKYAHIKDSEPVTLTIKKQGKKATFSVNGEELTQAPADDANYDQVRIHLCDPLVAITEVESSAVGNGGGTGGGAGIEIKIKLELKISGVKDTELPKNWVGSEDVGLWALENGVKGIKPIEAEGKGSIEATSVKLGENFWINMDLGWERYTSGFTIAVIDSQGGNRIEVQPSIDGRVGTLIGAGVQAGSWWVKADGKNSKDSALVEFGKNFNLRLEKRGKVATVFIAGKKINFPILAQDGNYDKVQITFSDGKLAILNIEGGPLEVEE